MPEIEKQVDILGDKTALIYNTSMRGNCLSWGKMYPAVKSELEALLNHEKNII
mgnify:FL=1